MDRYDPGQAPDPEERLELDETERSLLVKDHHRRAHVKLPGLEMHATIHAVVETQLAADDPPAARLALARLQAGGLDRHEAIHAIGSVLTRHLYELMQGTPPAGDPTQVYVGGLARLTVESWRRGG